MRRTLGVVLVGAMLLTVSAGTASASTLTVTQAIKAQDKIVHSNPDYKELKTLKVKTVAQVKAAIPKFRELGLLLNRAANSVASASATSGQKLGQTDWVSGARMTARGIDDTAVELTDLVKGDKAAAQKAQTASNRLDKSGDTLGSKGDRLLGLPMTD